MEMVHLTNTIENLKAEREELAERNAEAAATSARAQGQLAETKADLAENEKFLSDMKATYETKTATYESNQKVRKEELEALDKAIEIIASPTVSDAYGTHVNAELLQKPVAASPRKLS